MADDVATFNPASGQQLGNDSARVNIADKLNEAMGGQGLEVIANNALHTAPTSHMYCAFFVLTDAVINAIVADASAPITGTLTGVTLSAGVWVYGKFTAITLTSGSVIAYLGVLV